MRLNELEDAYAKKPMLLDYPRIVQFIQENCQPYLQANPNLRSLYRGVPDGPMVFTKPVRPNRRPRDSFRPVHNFMNLLIHKAGKTADRTNSVFAIGTKVDTDGTGTDMATYYGTPYVIFPIGNFHYTWSTEIKDFYVAWDPSKFHTPSRFNIFNDENKKRMPEFSNGREQLTLDDPRLDQQVISMLVNSFKGDDGTLDQAIASKHEIMIQASSVLYVQSTFIAKLTGLLMQ